MRILLVEDDERIALPIQEDLLHQCYVVDLAVDGPTGLHYATSVSYDLVLLDIMLPGFDGLTLCRELRDRGLEVPILLLTALDRTGDRVRGLDSGADDYLVKPFSLDELGARVRALLRRNGPTRARVLKVGNLSLDPARLQASYAGQALALTPREFRLLECFLRHPGCTFSREALLERLWDTSQGGGEDLVKTHILRLRRKLQAAGAPADLLRTLHGFGYRLELPDNSHAL
ncbi:response regulator transcription factor [Gloeobacter kilaueensis]|uniref:Two component transcriptional regulator, winged helix family n=1 Tax=Gloeobacter kilaueensis (strain ATCC BAA-2537 / CCAP 1431/1 / ULC 316 / JS1) TaxID=1183438 RepID=U5QLI8_GLOK1|nr:response regulator transcription factor [Gloeobacter kilaueensis]AGY59758.1 two component transcriptional regulator, winged helix family [Gloeobacter kilaueensis JS1]